jgi:predicted AlkP superfamily pyrophosphatase or phosphodiesterase
MHPRPHRILILLLALIFSTGHAIASAYNARPKLVVLIVVDQLRGDLLERYHDQFVEGGFRLLMDKGAYFSNCNYQYANTRTAPGHATIGTGTYTLGHGILANEYWDAVQKKKFDSTFDSDTRQIGGDRTGTSSSPRALLATTFSDELRLATAGKSRVYGVALKDRAALLPVGYSANGAFWIDRVNGQWVTSTYYMKEPPAWLVDFNHGKRAEKYLNLDWKDADGNIVGHTRAKERNGKPMNYYDTVGETAYANDYEIEFTRELIERENLGEAPTTDFLSVSFSAPDVLGHRVGPDSPKHRAMLLALDRQLAGFFSYLARRYGLANIAIALTADHGISPVPEYSTSVRIPGKSVRSEDPRKQLNAALSKSLGKTADYVPATLFPLAYLNPDAFAAVNVKEADAEHAVGEAMKQIGFRNYFTKTQLANGDVPNTVFSRKYLNSYSPNYGWYVFGLPAPYNVDEPPGETDHSMPYGYDTHVPLAFYGVAFRPGNYREAAEPVDLAVTLSSLLGINPPSSAVGRVLSEAFASTPAAQPTEATR